MTTTTTDTRARAEEHLRALVGRDDARLYDDQWAAIEALAVDHRRALVVQRTGWGKSAVYFVATLLLREAGSGPTVIISPLLALMRNQIGAAERAGVRAVTINSTNIEQWEETHAAIERGEVDVLLVSPERLNNPGFRDEVMPRLAATCGLLVVDEAHCISDWGHDFRPDYRRIRTLLAELPDGIPVLATTATANQRVTDDVAEQLGASSGLVTGLDGPPRPPGASDLVTGLDGPPRPPEAPGDREARPGGRGGRAATVTRPEEAPGGGAGHPEDGDPESAEVLVLRGSLDRESLRLGVVRLPTPEQRLAWLADHLDEQPGSGIIYCLTVAATQDVADYLRSRGHEVAAYSGQTEPTERHALEQSLLAGEVKALVATSALGMGFDATLGFVVNLGAPSSPVAYYQQVGRAGRGTDEATVVLLPAVEDRDIWAYFASLAFPREEQVRQTLAALADEGRPMSTATLETYVDLGRNRLETMLKVLDVDGAVRRVKGGWEATGQEWVYDADRYRRVAEAREREQRAMLDYIATDQCRMWFLRDQLDDPEAVACGRCDNCGGFAVPATVDEAAVTEAGSRLQRPGVPIQPRRMWPTALANLGLDLKGKIRAQAEEGRTIARLTDLGHGQALRDLFRVSTGSTNDRAEAPETVPVGLVKAMVAVLDDWRPPVDAIVRVDSATRPSLTRDLADGLSRYLGVPVVAAYAIVDPDVAPGQGATNSAQRIAAVRRRYAIRGTVPEGARVLLVDDRVGTGWTLTMAAHDLRTAGATAVYPVTLASGS